MVTHTLMLAFPASVEVGGPEGLMELPLVGVGTPMLSQGQLQEGWTSHSCSFPSCSSSVAMRSLASPTTVVTLMDDLEHMKGQLHYL